MQLPAGCVIIQRMVIAHLTLLESGPLAGLLVLTFMAGVGVGRYWAWRARREDV